MVGPWRRIYGLDGCLEMVFGSGIVKKFQNKEEKFGDSEFLAIFALAISHHAMRK